jgi:hypothetical protein
MHNYCFLLGKRWGADLSFNDIAAVYEFVRLIDYEQQPALDVTLVLPPLDRCSFAHQTDWHQRSIGPRSPGGSSAGCLFLNNVNKDQVFGVAAAARLKSTPGPSLRHSAFVISRKPWPLQEFCPLQALLALLQAL